MGKWRKNEGNERFFEKKLPKVLPVPKKSITFAPAIERDGRDKRNFRASREQNNLFFCRGAAGKTEFRRQAEIAQLVEHNLAKVGVAGPSPVFRSLVEQKRGIREWP